MVDREPPTGPIMPGEGLLEISSKGFGFLRQRSRNYAQHPQDIFVTPEVVRKYGLRDGVYLKGDIRSGNRGPQLVEVKSINDTDPSAYKSLPIFEELTAINPNKRVSLETSADRSTTRVIDMIAPIGKGQRGLIVAPPRTGKTTLLQHIAEAVADKYDEMHLILLLIDERPEEVTELTRSLPQAEIFASSNDSEPKQHARIAVMAIERARRLVEAGRDVFIVLDSITRLARAFNNIITGGGGNRKTMSGGIDSRALEMPRKLFAAARNTREAGSLTIVATALIETGSKADELIFQEFKGTGNMELVLDRKISQNYVFPSVDIFKSGTRREELLIPGLQLEKINLIRRGLSGHKPIEAIERLLHFIRRHPNNAQMLLDIPKTAFA
jgi:transcription termination factor Rho